jgi:hypothetical protein
VIVVRQTQGVIPIPAHSPVIARPGISGGAPGAKGDPGGNVMAIGLFTDGHTLTIPSGTDLVRTSGYSTVGIGSADYVYDATVDSAWVAAHPGGGFVSANSRGFRLAGAHGISITPQMFGYREGINIKTTSEVVYDNSDAMEAAWSFFRYLNYDLNLGVTLDCSGCRAGGLSRQLLLNGTTNASFWDTRVLQIIPGRIGVCMTNGLDPVVKFQGKTIHVVDAGEWGIDGGTYGEVATGYGTIKAKTLVEFEDIGGSQLGNFRFWGARRFAIKASGAGGITPNNNIASSIGNVFAIRCGNWGTSGSIKFNGTYASGSWLGNPANSDSNAQRHRMTITPEAGCDPTDLEVGDSIWFNSSSRPAVVMAINSTTSTTATIEVYPWQSAQASGTFRSMHGGALDVTGGNLANLTIERLVLEVGGTYFRGSALYMPLIKDGLGEFCGIGAQIGMNGLESMEGFEQSHFHFENTVFDVIDCMGASSGARFGTASNISGNSDGKYGKVIRLNPARVSGGAYVAPVRTSLFGISFEHNGGRLSSPNAVNVEKNLGGAGSAVISNSPEYRLASVQSDTMTFSMLSEPSEVMAFRQNWAMVEVYGTGTNDKPTTVTFEIDPFEVHPCTIDGSTSPKVFTGFTGPVLFAYTLELAPEGSDAHNWKVHAIPLSNGTPTLGGGGGGLSDGDKGDVVVSSSGAVLTVESAAGDFVVAGNLAAADGSSEKVNFGSPAGTTHKMNLMASGAFGLRIESSGSGVGNHALQFNGDGITGFVTPSSGLSSLALGSYSNHDIAFVRWGDTKLSVKDTSIDLSNGAVAIKIAGNKVLGVQQIKPGTPTLADVIACLDAHGLWA